MATAKQSQKHHLNDLPQQLRQTLQSVADSVNLELKEIHWVLACSGGKDSAAMAHALSSLSLDLSNVTLAHVNHGLQPQAESWAIHCRELAEQFEFNYVCFELNLDITRRQSLEALARNGRYAVLREYCKKNDGVLLLAQHANDQLETLLLQLKRGAGPKGLSGMAKSQVRDGVMHVRPWLDQSQNVIVEYVEHHAIAHVNDPSNTDNRFDRNFLRNKVLPHIIQRWPQITKSVQRSAQLCAQQQALIEEQADNWLENNRLSSTCIPYPNLSRMSDAWQAEILRHWFTQQCIELPSKAQLDSYLKSLKTVSEDKVLAFQWRDNWLRLFSKNLYLTKSTSASCHLNKPEQVSTYSTDIINGQTFGISRFKFELGRLPELPDNTALLDFLRVDFDDAVRLDEIRRAENVRVKTDKTRTAKRLFKEYCVPPWCRENVIGIWVNDVLRALLHQEGLSTERCSHQCDPSVKREIDQTVKPTSNRAYLVVLRDKGPDPHV